MQNRLIFMILLTLVVLSISPLSKIYKKVFGAKEVDQKTSLKIHQPIYDSLTENHPTIEKDLLNEAPLGLTGTSLEAMRSLQLKYNTGDYESTLNLAQQQLRNKALDPVYRNWIKGELATILTSAGWLKIQSGDCSMALQHLERSVALKRERFTLKGLAICHLRKKNLISADEYFRLYLKDNTKDNDMKFLYTELLETFGDYAQAVEIMDELVSKNTLITGLSPNNLIKRLSAMRSKAIERHHQVSLPSAHFTLVYYAEDHEGIADMVMETLHIALEEYVQEWGMKYPTIDIEVLLYPDHLFKGVVAYGPLWAAGLYDGRIRIPITTDQKNGEDVGSLRRILRHELAHALLAEMVDRRALPTWFNEGVAQYLECNHGCQNFNVDRIKGEFLKLSELIEPFVNLDLIGARKAYKQSLFLVNVIDLLYKDRSPAPLATMIEALSVSSPTHSNGLLSPIRVEIAEAYQLAKSYWEKSKPPSTQFFEHQP